MAGRTLSTAGLVAKWIVIPIVLVALGYYIVGPRIGGAGNKPVAAPNDAAATTDQTADTATDQANSPEFNPPEATVVGVRKVGGTSRRLVRDASPSPDGAIHRRKRRHRMQPAPQTPNPTDAPEPIAPGMGTTGGTDGGGTDGGSTGGTTDGGGTTNGGAVRG